MKKIALIIIGITFFIFKPAHATVIYDGTVGAGTFSTTTVYATGTDPNYNFYFAKIIGPLSQPGGTLYFRWSGLGGNEGNPSHGAWLITDSNATFSNYPTYSTYQQLFYQSAGVEGTVTGTISDAWNNGDYAVLYWNQYGTEGITSTLGQMQIAGHSLYDAGHYAQDWIFYGGVPGQAIFDHGNPMFCITTLSDFSDCGSSGTGPTSPVPTLLLPTDGQSTQDFDSWVVMIPTYNLPFTGRVGVKYHQTSSVGTLETYYDYVDGTFSAENNVFLIPNTRAKLGKADTSTNWEAWAYTMPINSTNTTYDTVTEFSLDNRVISNNPYCPQAHCISTSTVATYVINDYPNLTQAAMNAAVSSTKQKFPFKVIYELSKDLEQTATSSATSTDLDYNISLSGRSITVPLNHGSSTLAGIVGTDTKNLIFNIITAFLWIIFLYTAWRMIMIG